MYALVVQHVIQFLQALIQLLRDVWPAIALLILVNAVRVTNAFLVEKS